MSLKQLSGAVAVITGGASGIGLATACALRAKDADVVLADINRGALQQAAQQVHQNNPSSIAQVLTVVTDVTSEEQVQECMRQALALRGRIDLVVTCAGVGWGGPIDTFTGEQMQNMMNINFMGTYHTIRAALPAMRQQQSGHFVLLSSVAGKLCPPLLSGYAATKWAVRGLSSALRAELYGTGIGITTVYPAWVDTPMVHQEGMEYLDAVVMLKPDQVAAAILQAVLEDKSDLTLAPNPDIAAGLQLMHDNQDHAEQVVGKSFYQRMHESTQQQS
jgi:NAD(P)-dependent dehydrogenase (short-subunit alcohol dehydrogenase family)